MAKSIIVGIVVGLINYSIGLTAGYFMFKDIPSDSKVQRGYIAPSKIEEITCTDLDQNGELETIIKIGNTPYLLRDVDGKPVLSAYEIKPA